MIDDIPRDLIKRYDESQFQIQFDGDCYAIVDVKWNTTIANEFYTYVDALVFLEEEAKLI
ncbi:MAG: hypothetical protein JSV31_10345 [Desulfobacterales bacterium]|nr:MAG: hypothetical protein JSV31_10345 [Desulfobacterales bacterium]